MFQMSILTNYVSSVMLRPKKKMEMTAKIRKTQSAVKWSQIRRRIELCMREIILCFDIDL
jgi:hypothetical protein